ncbi:hypothetical protein [Kitasatospora sp. NBC_01266]|uniref:hypothetical protein n=1 Tax=Kitasatospora sp. NBC_01266 TaxID=2903572 RepID=UPI002E33CFE4|nr:hypothetical protein [Kitasatospora sp. NBC_01266]
MPTTLEAAPVDQVEQQAPRIPLDELSALGADLIIAPLHRALPEAEADQEVAGAFNSSI